MYFSTPIWLFALLPWLGLAGWMMWGRRRRAPVPFLEMWEGPAMELPPQRGIKLPPAGVVWVMLGLLLAIAAAAGPMVKRGGLGATRPALAVVVDHGLTMSAASAEKGEPRYVAAAGELARMLQADEPGSLPIAVVDPLSDRERWTDVVGLAAAAAAMPATDLNAQSQTDAAVGRALSERAGPVIVLTDRGIASKDSRVVRVSPGGIWSDIAISAIAARAAPVPEVMLRLRNDSAESSAAVTVRSGKQGVSRTVELPGRGLEREYFFDLPVGETIEARVGDRRAYLMREGLGAKMFPSPDLPAAVARMVRVYSRERGKSSAAGRGGAAELSVQIVTSLQAVSGAAPAVIAAPAVDAAKGPIVAADDPVTRAVNWSMLAGRVRVSGSPPDGWRVVLSEGGQPMVAVRDRPARQVWVGFDAKGFSATPAFVVFWTNVLDWSAGSSPVYAASLVKLEMDNWRRVPKADDPPHLPADAPGIYARGDGSRQAFNAPPMPPPDPPIAAAEEQAAVHRIVAQIGDRRSGRDAGPIAMWLALGCLVAAAVVWKQG